MNENEEQKIRKLLKASPPLSPPESMYRAVLDKIEREREGARERGKSWNWNIPIKTLATVCALLLVIIITRETRMSSPDLSVNLAHENKNASLDRLAKDVREGAKAPEHSRAQTGEPVIPVPATPPLQIKSMTSNIVRKEDVQKAITQWGIQTKENQEPMSPSEKKNGLLKGRTRAMSIDRQLLAPGGGGTGSSSLSSGNAPSAAVVNETYRSPVTASGADSIGFDSAESRQAITHRAPEAPQKPAPWEMEARNSVGGVATNGSFLAERKVEDDKELLSVQPAPKRADQNVEISGPASKRKIVHKAVPAYPEWAQEIGARGTVRIYFMVAADGAVSPPIWVNQSSGHTKLDLLAIDTIKTWKFAAAPEDTWGIWTFEFPPKN